jgi:hypothetical protein
MMRRLTSAERTGAVIWLIAAAVVWNGIYDLLLTRSVKEYLFRAALHDLGRGPQIPIKAVMDAAVYDAVWIATLWAGMILLAGLVTLRVMRHHRAA